MQSRKTWLLLLSAALALALAGCAAQGVSAQEGSDRAPDSAIVPTVTVTGEGKLTLTPDQATVNLGVESRGKDVAQASEANAQAMEQVMQALQGLGVAQEDMKTVNYNIYQDYMYRDGKSEANGYVVNNTLQVVLYDLERVGEAVDAAVAAGANSSYGISFGVKDPSARKAELAALAAQDARAQAEAYAKACGRTVGEAVSITSGSGAANVVVAEESMQLEAAAMDAGASRNAGSSFSAGTMELTERVTICYRMD